MGLSRTRDKDAKIKMPSFGRKSSQILSDAHPDLQLVLFHSIKHVDFSVICSKRNKIDQEIAFNAGRSKAFFGESPHNWMSDVDGSLAVDIVPWPIPPWNSKDLVDKVDTEIRFKKVLNVISIVSDTLGIRIVLGMNFKSIKDYPHIELANWDNIKRRLVC